MPNISSSLFSTLPVLVYLVATPGITAITGDAAKAQEVLDAAKMSMGSDIRHGHSLLATCVLMAP